MHTQVLTAFSKSVTYVPFDADNPEHLLAYALLYYHGRQHPTLRFQLEEPFRDVVRMMHAKLVEKMCKDAGILEPAKAMHEKLKADRAQAKPLVATEFIA